MVEAPCVMAVIGMAFLGFLVGGGVRILRVEVFQEHPHKPKGKVQRPDLDKNKMEMFPAKKNESP